MGRPKYSPQAVDSIMAAFVKATKDLIEEHGFAAASIRRVAAAAGYSSATVYLYFEDMNELVTMSLISSLSGYVNDLAETEPEDEKPIDAYVRSWRLFCKHAFSHPSTFLNLFFGPRADELDAIAKKYYELFPEDLKGVSGRMLEMFAHGDLYKRNGVVLSPLAKDFGLSEREAEIANDLTVSYFHAFLTRAAEHDSTDEEIAEQTERFIEGVLFILRCDRASLAV